MNVIKSEYKHLCDLCNDTARYTYVILDDDYDEKLVICPICKGKLRVLLGDVDE